MNLAAWLTDNLPRESYPYIVWASGHFDLARPMAIAGLSLYLAVIGLLVCGGVALFRRFA